MEVPESACFKKPRNETDTETLLRLRLLAAETETRRLQQANVELISQNKELQLDFNDLVYEYKILNDLFALNERRFKDICLQTSS
jgi:hypothetical protein